MTDSPQAPSFLEDYGLQHADHPVFVWDGDADGFAWANGAGLNQWGALSLHAFRTDRLDRAMPAMIRLRELAKTALPPEGIDQTLMFWTSRGACRLDCKCRPIDLGDGGHGLILEVMPSLDEGEDQLLPPTGPRDRKAYLPNGVTRLSQPVVNASNGKRVSGYLNGVPTDGPPSNMPAPTDADHEAMAEIARMLGQPAQGPSVTEAPVRHLKLVSEESGARLRTPASTSTVAPSPFEELPETPGAEATDFDTLNHELRTPLNSIIGFAEMMQREQLGPIGNARYKEYAGDILDSAHHALSLINDLLDASRVRAGHLSIAREDINVPELLERVIALMQPQAQKANLTIVPGFPDTLPTLLADARAMRQILLNLLSNAIKFTGPGGRVFVTAQQDQAGEMTIAIRDTGRGMSDDELEQAMTPWGQARPHEHHGDQDNGSGLGLPLVKALTEAQGGLLRLSSAPGEGTRAEVIFPATDAPSTPA